MPSAASSLSISSRAITRSSATAASVPSTWAVLEERMVAQTPRGARLAMVRATVNGLVAELAGWHDLLDQAYAQGLCCVESVASEKPAHGVAPSGDLRQTNRGPAERKDASVDLDLSESRPLRGQANVGREHELYADGEAPALCGEDERLLASSVREG